MSDLRTEVVARFRKIFYREPVHMVRAPGRVNLIGEHTDYNDGFVFPMAIEREVVIVASPSAPQDGVPAGYAKVVSMAKREPAYVKISGSIQPGPRVTWSEYVQGVVAGFLRENPGVEIPSFVAVIHSSVPLGAALSSSAALEVGVATMLEALTGAAMYGVTKALLCQKAEHEFAKMPCGIMDQFISAMGKRDHLMLLDCRDYTTRLVPFTAPDLSILIVNTCVKHQLSGSEYPERRASCHDSAAILGVASLRDLTMDQLLAGRDRLTDLQFRRVRHVVGEIARTTAAADALVAGQFELLGQLMYQSHDSLRDDFEVSCPELDVVVEICRELGQEGGVFGARMTGGGFGGCAVALVRSDRTDALIPAIRDRYRARTGIEPELFVTRPAEGAEIVAK